MYSAAICWVVRRTLGARADTTATLGPRLWTTRGYPQSSRPRGLVVGRPPQTRGVRIELSLVGPAGCRDAAIVAAQATPLEFVAPELAALVGAAGTAPVWSGSRPLAGDAALGSVGLRTGSVLTFGAPGSPPPRPGLLALQLVGGPQAGVVHPLEPGCVTIGRASDCTVVLDDDHASRQHAALDVARTSLVLRDLSSTNGTSLDGVPVAATGRPVRAGQIIRIGDSLLAVAGAPSAPATIVSTADRTLVNLCPRPPQPGDAADVVIPQPRESERPRRVQWITALLPLVAGIAIAWVARSPQFLLFALLSPVMLMSSSLGDRMHWRRSRRREAADHRRVHAAAEREVAVGLLAETAERRAAAPDPPTVHQIALVPTARLWERRRGDPDRLVVRVGTGDRPSVLQARSGPSSGSAGTMPNVPVTVDLRCGALGVAGPIAVAAGVARWIVTQLAVLHSPNDVELAFALTPAGARRWSWARWLPHLRGPAATTPAEWTQLVTDLTALVDSRRGEPGGTAAWAGRWTVLVVDGSRSLSDVPGLGELLSDGPSFGLTAICVDTDPRALPTRCTSLVRSLDDSGTRLSVRSGPATLEVLVDRVARDWAERIARALAPLVDASGSAAVIPPECRLFELLGRDVDTTTIAATWAANSGGAHTVLGVTADRALRVDLVADGPHVLVAGTTGSGKSELLRSLVAGLAATHPPDVLAFLLVDYKGGAAFAECAELPHTAGLVTDLDQHLTRRALQSLHAELRRRERLFAAAGAADLSAFRALCPDPPIPRLMIVIDEFAALAEDLPEFVQGIVGVAQRGRSLGVHLILATQRPGSAVSADIRANTSLRIALRVTDPAESCDVIDAPDAARIDRSLPGRAYLRAGSALVGFQSARIGGVAATPTTSVVEALSAWRRRVPRDEAPPNNDLARLVGLLSGAAAATGRAPARSPWLPPLPRAVAQDEVTAGGRAVPVSPLVVPIGLLDRPDEQSQPALTLDLAAPDKVLVVGRTGSGRTTALTTAALGAAAGLDPAQLEIYVIDGSGDLAAVLTGLPHLATVVEPRCAGLAVTLLERLTAAVFDPAAGDDARALLLVDAWDRVLSRCDDAEGARCTELLTDLVRGGTRRSPTVLVAGDRSLLTPRFAGQFGTRLILRMADHNDYSLAGLTARDVPAALPAGRGVRGSDGVVFQLAHAGSAPDLASAQSRVRELAIRPGAAGSRSAVRLRPLPDTVHLDALGTDPAALALGLAGDAAAVCSIDLVTHRARFLVAGPPRAGKSSTLCVLLSEARRTGLEAVVAGTARSPVVAAARRLGIAPVGPADPVGPVPSSPTLLLVDDSESFADGPAGEQLLAWLRDPDAPLAVVAAGRSDDLATAYRGIAAEVRRSRCGVLLRPGPLDGELLGVRLGRSSGHGPPGRGWLVGDPCWGPLFEAGAPVPIQVARL